MSDFELPMRPPRPAGTTHRGTSLPAALALAGAAVGVLASAWLIHRALTGPGGDEGDGTASGAGTASGVKAAAQGAGTATGAGTAGDTGAAAQSAGTAGGTGAAGAAAAGSARVAGGNMARGAGAAAAQPDDPATMLGQLRSAEGAVLDELGLSADERCIGRLVMRGLTYRQIAGRVYLAERTVKYHARHLYAKARVGNRRAFEAYVRRRLAERADA